MNKKFSKSTLVVAMIAVAGYSSYKAYEGYAENSNWLLLENVEALSEAPESGTPHQTPRPEGETCYVYVNGTLKSGNLSKCYDDTVDRNCTNGICMIQN